MYTLTCFILEEDPERVVLTLDHRSRFEIDAFLKGVVEVTDLIVEFYRFKRHTLAIYRICAKFDLRVEVQGGVSCERHRYPSQ